MTATFPKPKDPAAILYYEVDWSQRLGDGVTITGEPVMEAPGLNLNPNVGNVTVVVDGQRVRFWLGGGIAETFYPVSCLITTSDGQTDRRTIVLHVANR